MRIYSMDKGQFFKFSNFLITFSFLDTKFIFPFEYYTED